MIDATDERLLPSNYQRGSGRGLRQVDRYGHSELIDAQMSAECLFANIATASQQRLPYRNDKV